MKTSLSFKSELALSVGLLGALTGCVAYDNGPHAQAYGRPPTVYVQTEAPDDYVYYPGYQVYYSNNRRQYVYQDGRSWVSRPAPPRVSVDVLVASPSVRLDFHDAPSSHHAAVVKQYPKRWTPPPTEANHGDGKRNDKNENDHGDRR